MDLVLGFQSYLSQAEVDPHFHRHLRRQDNREPRHLATCLLNKYLLHLTLVPSVPHALSYSVSPQSISEMMGVQWTQTVTQQTLPFLQYW